MKKQIFLAAAVAAMMTALPLSALAGVVGSPHDLPLRYTYTGASAKQGTCSFCHVPHKAQSGGEKLFPVAADTNANNAWGSQDTLSLICWYCHGAGTQFAGAEQVNPFSPNAHLRNVATLTGWGDIGSLPADVKVAADNNLRCVSCHSIHDNARRPFLAWGTAAGDFSATATGFCSKCHANRSNASSIGTANPGNHPSATAMTDNGTNSPLTAATLPGIMQANMAALATTSAIGAPWNLGGHALYTGGVEQPGQFNCGSCHAVHMNETTDWASDTDGVTTRSSALAAAGNRILVANDNPLTAGNNEAVCVACHSVAGTRGPGRTGTGSHPFNTESTTASAMLTAARGYRWGTGASDSVIQCQSCHDIHWTTTGHTNNTGAVALAGDYLIAYACNDCHSAAGTTAAYANHHPSNITVTEGTTVKTDATTSTATDWAALTQTATTTQYFAATNLMSCDTCHGLGAGKAHNNPAGSFPGLSGDNTDSGMCVDCHTFNPSTFTGHGTTGTGTHYVGTIKTASYKKTDTFITGATDNVAKWSADGGADGSIICESCHTLKINGKNGHVITYATSLNTGDGVASTSDSVRLLLEVSGNMRTVAAAADSMCTECHGATPGAGVTHPVQPTWTAAASAKITVTGDATLTSGTSGNIVCESCHRPHDAASATGLGTTNWILEAATAKTGYTDYSSLCNLCHPQGN